MLRKKPSSPSSSTRIWESLSSPLKVTAKKTKSFRSPTLGNMGRVTASLGSFSCPADEPFTKFGLEDVDVRLVAPEGILRNFVALSEFLFPPLSRRPLELAGDTPAGEVAVVIGGDLYRARFKSLMDPAGASSTRFCPQAFHTLSISAVTEQ